MKGMEWGAKEKDIDQKTKQVKKGEMFNRSCGAY